MKLDEHKAECVIKLGDDFEMVHLWLDEFYNDPDYRTHHRKKRHHQQGINEVQRKWGDRAALAAKYHILSDLKDEMQNPQDSDIPLDEKDYIRKGYW